MTVTPKPRLRGFRRVATREGDDLQTVAARELGDAARWPELAALNNLVAPYIVDRLSDLEGLDSTRVVLAGASIKVPAPPPSRSGVADKGDIFGTDLDLTGGELSADAQGDLATLSGLPNLEQALRHRLDTPVRTLLYHPDYGSRLDELRGQATNPLALTLGAAYADRALQQDPRIARTEGTTATAEGDRLGITTTAVTVDGKNLPIGGT